MCARSTTSAKLASALVTHRALAQQIQGLLIQSQVGVQVPVEHKHKLPKSVLTWEADLERVFCFRATDVCCATSEHGQEFNLRKVSNWSCQVTSRPPNDAREQEGRRREGWPSGSVDKVVEDCTTLIKVDIPPTFSPSFFSSVTSALFVAMAIARRQRNQISLQHTRLAF